MEFIITFPTAKINSTPIASQKQTLSVTAYKPEHLEFLMRIAQQLVPEKIQAVLQFRNQRTIFLCNFTGSKNMLQQDHQQPQTAKSSATQELEGMAKLLIVIQAWTLANMLDRRIAATNKQKPAPNS